MNLTLKAVLGAAPLLLVAACSHDTARDSSQFTTMEPEVYQQPPITKFADANKDGKVTREEAKADPNLARNFSKYDLDKNNILDRGEFAKLEADTREERVASGQNEAMQPLFRGHPLTRDGDTLNRTGERGP